jgi:hypothetical protein
MESRLVALVEGEKSALRGLEGLLPTATGAAIRAGTGGIVPEWTASAP